MNNEVQKINVDTIIPNRFQPRKNFDQEALNELADSIRQHGIIQPLVLRKLGDKYEIIAGERRYKAANLIGLKTVPAIVMEIDDASSAEIALIENVQRKDLTAIEEAKSYQKILELGQMNQEELAKRVGKKQSTVSNKLRLLNLSEEAQQALLDNKISERHARSLLRLKETAEQNNMLNKIIDNRMTVRETDIEIKTILGENNKEQIETAEEIIDFQMDTIPDIPANTQTNETTPANLQNDNPPIITPSNITQPEIIQNNNPDINMSNNKIENNFNTVSGGQLANTNIPEYDQIGIINPAMQDINSNPINDIPDNKQNSRPIVGKFFNLDDEVANMDVGNNFIPNQNNYIDPTQFNLNTMLNYNEHQQPNTEKYEYNSNSVNTNSEQITPKPIIAQQDITGAVAILRNTVMNLQNNGYIIDVNEEDSGTSYQIIVNIKK